jgi:hypothetical protein
MYYDWPGILPSMVVTIPGWTGLAGSNPWQPKVILRQHGNFQGMQIVKKYLERFPATTLAGLMKTDAGEIYSKAKYKPGS